MDLNQDQQQEKFSIQHGSVVLVLQDRARVQWLLSACSLPTSFDLLTQKVMNEGEMLFDKSRKHTHQNKASSQVHKMAKETA